MNQMIKRLLTLIAMIMVSFSVMAQVTTSAIKGQIKDNQGVPVIGAAVVLTHTPSGTVYAAITNNEGIYSLQGMRPGGPYVAEISSLGYKTIKFEELELSLGETSKLNAKLSDSVESLEGAVLIAKSNSAFSKQKTGATTNISSANISSVPTITRSISDIAQLSPYANGMSFSGMDSRVTNFTVDGATFNNNFGLNSKLPGGGDPISLEAIEEIQVAIAPFDVRQSNFSSGGINAITKSGTNAYKASIYSYYYHENLRGNKIDGVKLPERQQDRRLMSGITTSGPIVKNKLFYFLNLETVKTPETLVNWRPSVDGNDYASAFYSRAKVADMDRVKQHLLDKYGYNPGSYTDYPADQNNFKILARLDWNISQKHHLAFRYNYTNNEVWNDVNPSSSDAKTRHPWYMGRNSKDAMTFSNSLYKQTNKVSSFSLDLNSNFEKASNQLLVTYSNIQDDRDPKSSIFPFVDIMYKDEKTGEEKIEPYISFGHELFSYNNHVGNKVFSAVDNFTYYFNNHKITAGASFKHQMADNSYMRNGTGYYRYKSVDDFINGAEPETVALTYGYNGATKPRAKVRFNQVGAYLQDEYSITDRLNITAGIRFDSMIFNEKDLMRNNTVYDIDFDGRHIDTGVWPKAKVQVSPRFGFRWAVNEDRSLVVRGGTGLFAGRIPLVFFTGMPSNSGMLQNGVSLSTKYEDDGTIVANPYLGEFTGGLITNPQDLMNNTHALNPDSYPLEMTPDKGVMQKKISGVDRNFKMPQVWKTSIAVDYTVPTAFPLTLSAEFIYNENVTACHMENYNIKQGYEFEKLAGNSANGYPDHRYVYTGKYTHTKAWYACMLKNDSRGYGHTFNITMNTEPVEGLHIMGSYTHTVQKELSGLPGSDAGGAWSDVPTVNGPHFTDVHSTFYVLPHRFIASVDYRIKNNLFGLFYSGVKGGNGLYGGNASYVYNGDFNGDYIKNGDLMYIPKDDSEIKFADDVPGSTPGSVTGKDREAFWKFVEQDDYLSSHKGQYAEAFEVRTPFVHRFDFKYTHDFAVNVGRSKNVLRVSMDILNIGNLFNSSWGIPKVMASCTNGGAILKKVNKGFDSEPVFELYRDGQGNAPTETFEYSNDPTQCWRIQFGVKYMFNL